MPCPESPGGIMKEILIALLLAATQVMSSQSVQLPPASEMRPIILIGGTSWHSTIDYYRNINEAVNRAYGNKTNPPLIIWNMNNQRIAELESRNQWNDVAAIFSDAIKRLQPSGAQAVVLCAVTSHKLYAPLREKSNIRILHVGDATGTAIRKAGLKKVGLIGTRFTMENGFMADWLKQHYGIETLVPESASARQELHRIIETELDMGIYRPQSKKYVLDQIEELRHRGAQGIILGCTEFPLIIKPRDVRIPVFDTTRLHSQMAADFILGKQGLATVRASQ
jgi:aspartate racemase